MWDEQIGDVARQMTEGSARASLRASVLDRIEAGPEHRPWRMWMAISSVAAAGVAVLLVVLVLNTRETGRTMEIRASVPPQTPTTVTPPTAGAADPQPAAPTLTLTIATAPMARRTRALAQIQEPGERLEDVLLPLPESIDVEPLELVRLPPADSIATEPLVIAAVELEPFDQQDTDRQQR
jgi:hypothetical protein